VRLFGSLAWLWLFVLGFGLSIVFHGGPPANVAVVIGLCLIGQWILLQIPLWALAMSYGLRLAHSDDPELRLQPRDRQFGIGQLLLVTAVVAIFLGIGRAVVLLLGRHDFIDRESPIFVFLGVAAVALTLPLVLAGLMKRGAVLGVAAVLILTGLVTLIELPLLTAMQVGSGPHEGHFVSINVFTAATILVVLSVVRRCGYHLARTTNAPTIA
jgi:hypothetical protein